MSEPSHRLDAEPAAGLADRAVTFEWSAPAKQSAIIRANLVYDGHETPRSDTRGLSLLAIFAGAVLLPYLARALLSVQRDIRFGGIIVDTRGKTVVITHDQALDGGVILVVGPDGTKTIERAADVDPVALMATLTKCGAI